MGYKPIFILFSILTILSLLFILFALLLALLLKASPNGENLNLAFSITLGLYPKSSPVKYCYLFNSLGDNAEISAASLSKSYTCFL